MRMTEAQLKRVETITHNLYEAMPGAEPPPSIDLGDGLKTPAWDEVENTQHYEFCHAIAHLIVANSALEHK